MIEAGLDRPLNPWRRKCVIANLKDLVLARDFRDRFEVDQLEQRIARRFDPHHARVGLDRFFEILPPRSDRR